MWVATVDGFFSTVAKGKPGTVQVRGRTRGDLARFCERTGVSVAAIIDTSRNPSADYPYRVIVTPDVWAAYVEAAASAIDYANFKDRIGRADPARAHVYGKVWAALVALEEGRRGR